MLLLVLKRVGGKKSNMLTTSLLLKVDSSMDFCFPMDSDMNTDFKLDLVERLFAIDPEPKTPFTAQVTMPQEMVSFYICISCK